MVEQRPFSFPHAEQSERVAISDKNIERVVKQITERYGFVPTDLYVRDLIAFITEMTHNEPRE